MKNKKGNVTVIAIIIVIVAITVSVITWIVAKKTQKISTTQVITQNLEQKSKPVVNLVKFTKEEDGKIFNHVAVEYSENVNKDKKIIHEFVNEIDPDILIELTPQYKVSYLSQKYLVVTMSGGLAPGSDYLFDLDSLQEVKIQFPTNMGSILFFENEKYVAFEGIGRFAQPGISIEIINGKKVYCLISEEEVFDVKVGDGIMSFTEDAIIENNDGNPRLVSEKKKINIEDFCKNK